MMLGKILEILSLPIMFLNMLGGIVGGIWLAFLGEWRLIGIGLLLFITFHWILSILMMPGMLISGVAMYFLEKKNKMGYLFILLTQVYTNILILGTCVFAFSVCSNFYNGSIGVNYIPYLLWSWGMALGPWQFFASKEPHNEFSAITLFSASIFYFLFLISIFINLMIAWIIIILFGIIQLIILPLFNMFIAIRLSKVEIDANL
jgi:hypothetical protein